MYNTDFLYEILWVSDNMHAISTFFLIKLYNVSKNLINKKWNVSLLNELREEYFQHKQNKNLSEW